MALKLIPRSVRRQHNNFIKAGSAYIGACRELFAHMGSECSRETGLSVGVWGNGRDWPEKVLVPSFVWFIHEQMLGSLHGTFRLEDVSYNISSFTYSGEGFVRKGLQLATTYDAYSGLQLAQAGDEATLEGVRTIHRMMMEMEYGTKFGAEVFNINALRDKAEALALRVRDSLSKQGVS